MSETETPPRRALFAAGGTGGHMFPAHAAAEALIARGWRVRLLTDARGARHARAFPGGDVREIAAATPFVKNPVTLARNLTKLLKGVGQARREMRAFDADVVAGFGGYPAFPALAAARLSRTPFVIHEQNAHLGRVNRVFAKDAFAVASGFERLKHGEAASRREVTGNPVREAVLAAAAPYAPPEAQGELRLLVIGGSLGARILSETTPEAVARLPEELRARLRVTQQTRMESLERAREAYREAGVTAECEPFFEDMGRLYAEAHLVIARAGASTVAEIAALGRPAILVPLAIAMDDHQTLNADDLRAAGGAQVIAEGEFTAEALSARLETLLSDGEALARMAASAASAGRPSAHAALADLIAEAAERA